MANLDYLDQKIAKGDGFNEDMEWGLHQHKGIYGKRKGLDDTPGQTTQNLKNHGCLTTQNLDLSNQDDATKMGDLNE